MKVLLATLSILAFLVFPAAAEETNLLADGGFELLGTNGAINASGHWTDTGGAGHWQIWENQGETGGGDYGVWAFGWAAAGTYSIYQDVTGVPGESYKLDGGFRLQSTNFWYFGNQLEMAIIFLDSGSSQISSVTLDVDAAVIAAGAWEHHALVARAPASTDTVRCRIQWTCASVEGTDYSDGFYIDNVSFEAGHADLHNGGFELPTNGTWVAISASGDWTETGPNSNWTCWSGSGEGSQGIWMFGWANNVDRKFYQDVTAYAGAEYRLDAGFRLQTTDFWTYGSQMEMAMIWLDSNYTEISRATLDVDAAITTAGVWEHHDIRAIAPSGTVAVRSWFRWTSGGTGGNNRGIYMDNVTVVRAKRTVLTVK